MFLQLHELLMNAGGWVPAVQDFLDGRDVTRSTDTLNGFEVVFNFEMVVLGSFFKFTPHVSPGVPRLSLLSFIRVHSIVTPARND